MKLISKILVLSAFVLGVASCVPQKQFNEEKSKAEDYKSKYLKASEDVRELSVSKNELTGKIEQAERQVAELKKTCQKLEDENKSLSLEVDRLKRVAAELEKQNAALMSGSSEEISKLLTELQSLQNDLQEREDRVLAAEKALKEKESKLSAAQQELAQKQESLIRLQKALDDQKNAVDALRQSVMNALRGYHNKGLTVEERNGKVYVSMDEKLLFESGSYVLGENGKAALKDLGNVLASDASINIMVEGHTDNVPLRGANQIKDNWDLSVMRATAVTKIILENKSIDPKRVTASGRGEYLPLDSANTEEARQKNRRTEIILTPDLDKVLNILQTN